MGMPEITIVMKSARTQSGWEEVIGHACASKEAMENYCKTLDPQGEKLKIVNVPFNDGGLLPEPTIKETVIDVRDL